jgi:homoserine O-acetyltransferase/O-succinyltransferase
VTYAKGKTALLFDPSFARDFEKWKQAWDKTGILASEINRTEQGVRDFYYIKKRDPVTGAVAADNPNGYFMNDSEYARFHTNQRIGLIKGNPKELEQWANVYIFDIYTMVSELQKDDPKNLYDRLTQIKAPIFLAFGDKEPYIPATAFNGLKDLGRDVITPFMIRTTRAGNRPILKIYPDTGHFIHADNEVEYPADVVDFVTTGSVDTNSPVAIDHLINGATAAAAPAQEMPTGTSPTVGLNK